MPSRPALPPLRGERTFAAPPVARFVAAKTVGSFVPALTRKAFEKFGFSTAVLITDWSRIVGAELAVMTAPERLKWPRPADMADYDDGGTAARQGATLVLRVDPARALDIEYRQRQILERINAHFGYRAIAALRLVQAPLAHAERTPTTATAAPRGASRAAEPPAQTPEDGLEAALARLEQGVYRRV